MLRKNLRWSRDATLGATPVEKYWNRHTVNSKPFKSAEASSDYLSWRFAEYPLFRDFTGLWGEHEGKQVLDHGCGPGNDLVGFLLYSGADRVVACDVSRKALDLAAGRLRLHGIDEGRYELVHVSEADVALPFGDGSFDHVNSLGVIHHVSRPALVLAEFKRVLRSDGTCTIMVYNRDSVYFHLYTAYMRQIAEGSFRGLSIDEAFRRNTDGPRCPISRSYEPADFVDICRSVGFDATFVGGYFLKDELTWLAEHRGHALAAPALADEHKEFLRNLEEDDEGRPLYHGKHAGIGGVYRLRPA